MNCDCTICKLKIMSPFCKELQFGYFLTILHLYENSVGKGLKYPPLWEGGDLSSQGLVATEGSMCLTIHTETHTPTPVHSSLFHGNQNPAFTGV